MAGKALNIERKLGSARNRIHRIGIELEGAWRSLPSGVTLDGDGSIHIEMPAGVTPGDIVADPRTGRRTYRGWSVGELPSEPLDPTDSSSGIYWKPWIRNYYPSDVNASCGMHVHMSFLNALHYQRLMTPDYQETMATFLIEWAKRDGTFGDRHHIWKRLKGENEYCKKEFYADLQANNARKVYDHHREGNRYTGINYPHAMHQTIECRFLPMMKDAEQAISAIQRVLDITNACLAVMKIREKKHRVSDIEDEKVVEHSIWRV